MRGVEVTEARADPQKPKEKKVPTRSMSVGQFTKQQVLE